MFIVYIIFSKKLDRYYIGYTEDLELRLQQHYNGLSKYTSKSSDWVLVHKELFHSRAEAFSREQQIKRRKAENILNG